MKFANQWPMMRLACLTIFFAIASGCQSLPSSSGAVDLDKAIPGEQAQTRYAYMIEALKVLNTAMAKNTVSLPKLRLDAALNNSLPTGSQSRDSQNSDAIIRMAEQQLIGKGPFQLIKADTTNGRIEYRSLTSGHHLSITVRPLSAPDNETGQSFMVTEMFGQLSLTELLAEQTNRDNVGKENTVATSASLAVSRHAGQNDQERLAYFNSLPSIERDRADILGLRALLLARQEKNRQSSALVQTGIIRYSKIPLFYTIANVLFERSDTSSDKAAKSLSDIMQKRFKSSEIKQSQETVDAFLNQDASKAEDGLGA